ncbi:MAG: peptide chain release factor family protein [Deltaproteobacteria bacterium]
MKGSEDLASRMRRLGIREEDIIEKFVRSQGPGGQNVNKTSTCVYLKHVPTGIEVKCQQERSQAQNRAAARELLVERVERLFYGRIEEERRQKEKLRRQKRTRSRAAKARMLEDKKKHGEKKKLRAVVRDLQE